MGVILFVFQLLGGFSNPFMSGGLFYPHKLEESFHHLGVSGLLRGCLVSGLRKGVWFTYCQIYRNGCKLYANCVDPDLTPRSMVSGLGLLCLLMS